MELNLDQYPVVINEKVVWGEMDAFAHVNNTVYFRYFESVRIAYFERSGIMDYFKESQVGPILASTSCDFRAPLTYPDNIQIAAKVDEIREKRFNMHCVIYSERLGRIAAEGTGVVVYFDYKEGKTCQVPAQIIEAINNLESC